MEKKEKKKTNIILYSLWMLFVFVFITEGIVYGLGGSLVIESIFRHPQGSLVIAEAVLAAMVLVVMLLFKNSYVFTQKKEPLKTGLFYGLFYLIGTVLFIILYGVVDGGFQSGLAVLNVLIGALLVGVCEEFLCRGWLLNEFLERYGDTKKGIWCSIIISGIIFGLMHIINFFGGQPLLITIGQVVTATATGIFFGLIYYKTKNIWSVIILHGLWDFSLFLGDLAPITESTELIIGGISILSILYLVLTLVSEMLNIIPYIKDINAKPKKGTVIILAIVSFILFEVFTVMYGISILKDGETYKYGNLSLDNYAITQDNYEEYTINHTSKSTSSQLDVNGEIIENEVSNNYSFKLSVNDEYNLILTNLNTNDSIEIECESLYDYILLENNDNYILAYTDYENNANAFLNYIYIKKTELSNDSEYLNTIKNNVKKYLLPIEMELLAIHDYDNDKSYLSGYDMDYGYYVLVNENEMSVLNRD